MGLGLGIVIGRIGYEIEETREPSACYEAMSQLSYSEYNTHIWKFTFDSNTEE
jgi:hypothetical protein